MTRPRTFALLGSVLILGLLGLWFFGGLTPGPGRPVSSVKAKGGADTALAVDGLLEALQLIPLAGRPAPPFTLDTLEGGRFRLADLAGRPAFLYFWATW